MTTPSAPVAAPAAPAAPASPAAPAAPASPANAPADWTTTLDETGRGYVATKGFKTPGDVLTSYMNAEKLLGVPSEQILKLPKADGKPEEWNPVYDRLGRPAKAEDYKLEVPAGQSDAFAKTVAPVLHGLGLSAAQAAGLSKWWNDYQAGQGTEHTNAMAATSKAGADALAKEWGAAHDQNVGIAKATAAKFELDAKQIDALQQTLGYDGVFKLLHKIGAGLGEGSFHSGDGSTGFGGAMSPEQAKLEIANLQKDNTFTTKYVNGDADARKRMQQLQQWANPGFVQ